MSEHKIKITGDLSTMKAMRENDECIMDVLFKDRSITLAKLASCNRCRIYLQITTIAEMTTISGQRLRPNVLQVHKDDMIPNQFNWPNQERPSTYDRRVWKESVEKVLGVHAPYYKLSKDLGG